MGVGLGLGLGLGPGLGLGLRLGLRLPVGQPDDQHVARLDDAVHLGKQLVDHRVAHLPNEIK